MADETELEMVQRHVRKGVGHLERQARIIAELRERGAPTEFAIKLLEQFKDLQYEHKAHLSRLEARVPPPPANQSVTDHDFGRSCR